MDQKSIWGDDWCVTMSRHRKRLGFSYGAVLQGECNRRVAKGGAASLLTICEEGLSVCGRGRLISSGREWVSLRSTLVGVV